ncbi:MAG: hypothetical protein ABR927_01125 [Bacteroidales bacterium]
MTTFLRWDVSGAGDSSFNRQLAVSFGMTFQFYEGGGEEAAILPYLRWRIAASSPPLSQTESVIPN